MRVSTGPARRVAHTTRFSTVQPVPASAVEISIGPARLVAPMTRPLTVPLVCACAELASTGLGASVALSTQSRWITWRSRCACAILVLLGTLPRPPAAASRRHRRFGHVSA